jgi:hypothetical protein
MITLYCLNSRLTVVSIKPQIVAPRSSIGFAGDIELRTFVLYNRDRRLTDGQKAVFRRAHRIVSG